MAPQSCRNVVFATISTVAFYAGIAAPGNECKPISGMIVPACNAAICNQGSFTGDLAGSFTSKVTSIYPTKSGWTFTAWTRIALNKGKGVVETRDAGTASFDSNGGPDLSKSTVMLTITEATGAYQDSTGEVVIVGAYALGTPTPYEGRLCKPTKVD